MILCSNCKKFWIEPEAVCLNCGTRRREAARGNRLENFSTAFAVLLLVLLPVLLLGGLIAGWSYQRIGLSLLIDGLALVGVIVWIIWRSGSYEEDFSDEGRQVVRKGKNFEESLLGWEKRLRAKLKDLAAQLAAVKENQNNPSLNAAERESFNQAEFYLVEKQLVARRKLNAIGAARLINVAEYLYASVARAGDDQAEIGSAMQKLNVEIPRLKAFSAKHELDDETEQVLGAALNRTEQLRTELHRKSALLVLQGVYADGDASRPDSYLPAAAVGTATVAALPEPVTTEMFLREKFRLEILEILD